MRFFAVGSHSSAESAQYMRAVVDVK